MGAHLPELHQLVLQLRKAEMKFNFILHVVHVSGTWMIAQGMDGLSRGSFLEGLAPGGNMLAFIDIALSASPCLLCS